MPRDPHWLEQRYKDLFPAKPSATANGLPTNATTPGNLDRYVAAALRGVISDLADATEGNRNTTLNISAYRLGRFVGAGQLDENVAREQLAYAARRCGLSETEIPGTIQSGLEAGKREPFTLDGNDYRDAPPVEQAIPTTGLPKPADWQAILGDSSPEIDWLIDGIIERGRLHALFAPSKTHKSLIVQCLSAELARDAVVMYLDLENSRSDLRTRFLDMGHTADSLANLLYFPFPALPALDTPAGGAQLLAMADYYKPELIIIDTTSRVIKGAENDSDTFRALYRHALVHIKSMGIAVLRIDHAGKDVAQGQRGSSAKSDDVDTVWLLIKQDDDRFTLKCTHQRSGNHPDVINLKKCVNPLRFERLGESDTGNGPLSIDGIIRELDRLHARSDMGRQAAEKLLRSAGKNVRQRMVQEAVDIRKLRLDAESLSDLSGSPSGSGDFRQDHVALDQSLDHSQSEQPKLPDEPLDHSSDPGATTVIQGVPEVAGSSTGGAISPPVIQPTDTAPSGPSALLPNGELNMEQLAQWFGRVRILECQAKRSPECTGTSALMQVQGKTVCRQCAFVDGKHRNMRCCRGIGVRLRHSCMGCSLFSAAVDR